MDNLYKMVINHLTRAIEEHDLEAAEVYSRTLQRIALSLQSNKGEIK